MYKARLAQRRGPWIETGARTTEAARPRGEAARVGRGTRRFRDKERAARGGRRTVGGGGGDEAAERRAGAAPRGRIDAVMRKEARHRCVAPATRGLHLRQRRLEIAPTDHHAAAAIAANAATTTITATAAAATAPFDGSAAEGERGGAAYKASELRPGKVLGECRERLRRRGGHVRWARVVGRVDEAGSIVGERAVGTHRACVDAQDVAPTRFVGQRDLELDLETAGAQQRVVDQLRPVG